MSLTMVIHRPDAATDGVADMRAAMRDAVWEVADAHWALSDDTMLVSCDLSPAYLLAHFEQSLSRRGFASAGLLLVTTIGPRAAWRGLPAEAESWLHDTIG